MAGIDQLEVIDPTGEVRFIDLDPARGVTNIGSHPENDVVLDSPAVAEFHALLDHRQRPYQFVVFAADNRTTIGGVPLTPNVPYPLNPWDAVDLDGHALMLVEGGGAPPTSAAAAMPAATRGAPVAAGSASAGAMATAVPAAAVVTTGAALVAGSLGQPQRLRALPPEHADDFLVVELAEREWVVDCDQTASFQLTVANGGDLVAVLAARIDGVDPEWVVMTPPQVNLFEGERATIGVTITPPRKSSSRAGTYYLSIVVSSPNYPGRFTSLSATLVVNPYYEYVVGDLSPQKLNVKYRRPTGLSAVPISNRGNSETTYRLDGEDDERGCRFEFLLPGEAGAQLNHADLKLSPEQEPTVVNMRITPNKRQFFGVAKHNYMYTITVSPLGGVQAPRSVLGQLASAPYIGPWIIAVAALVLAAILVLIFRPTISYFGDDSSMLARRNTITVDPGTTVRLFWRTSRFASLSIASDSPQDPQAGPVAGPIGSKEIKAEVNVVYTLHAENLLTRLNERLFGPTWPVTIQVNRIRPGVVFTGTAPQGKIEGNTITIERGQSVVLQWKVDHTNELFLNTNGAPETIAPEQYTSSRTVKPDIETTYSLVAKNNFTPPEGDIANIVVKVVEPPATPWPIPVIQRFDVQPSVITQGESVRLDWVVTGAQAVTIDGLPSGSNLALSGSLDDTPAQAGTTRYVLKATSPGQEPVQLQRTVTVNPAPPPAVAPTIVFFTATPNQVVAGSPDANDIKLSWSVSGTTTDIKINGPDFGGVSGLPAEGTISVTASKTTLYVLTASNGATLSSSATQAITVLQPTATPTPSPTPLPVPVVIFSAAVDPLHPDPVASVVVVATNSPDTRKYEVVSGTWVKFSWTATGAAKVVFNGEDKAPEDSSVLLVTLPKTLLFSAINAQGGTTNLSIVLDVIPRQPPPVPSNVNGPALSVTGPLTITWDYPSTAIKLITGFKVYRADQATTSFVGIKSGIPPTFPYRYADPDGTCGLVYYVVAEYTDLDQTKETGPSTNSWYSEPCPTPTPPP